MGSNLKYGLNFTASDIAPILEQNNVLQNGVRSWRQRFGNAGIGYETQVGQLTDDYTAAMSDAYKTHLQAKENIYRAGLNASGTNSLLRTHDQNLASAYSTYIQKFREGLNTLGAEYASEVASIDEELANRAQNFADLYSSAYKYWTDELSKSTILVDDLSKPKYEGEGKNAVATGEYEKIAQTLASNYGLTDLLNEDGTAKTWEEASHMFLTANGQLTDRGRQFFDQAFNIKPEKYSWTDDKGKVHTTRGFTQWLSDTNSDLYNWAMSGDVSNYTRAGTNLGSAKSIVGLESDDTNYAHYEYQDWNDLKNYGKDFSTIGMGKEAADLYTAANDIDVAASIWEGDPLKNKRKRKNKFAEAKGKFSEYTTSAVQQHGDLVAYAKKVLGPEAFATFQTNNASLVNEYQSIYEDMIVTLNKTDPTADEVKNVISRFDNWQKRYYGKLEEYSKLPKPKASGY